MKLKRIRKCFLAAGVAAMILLQTMSAFAADKYTYTITISAGNRGEIQDAGVELVSSTASKFIQGGKLVITGLSYNDKVNVSYSDVVKVVDNRYYAKVLRESGKDNGIANVSSITVTDDRDYVVGYGIMGDRVAYTVNYVDENGTALGASNTYYGNVGDRPVIAYHYFEGYLPQAYNLTKTLVSNEAENVFTFTYRKMTPEEIINYVTVPAEQGTTTPGGTTTPEGTTTPAGTTTPGGTTTPEGTGEDNLTEAPEEQAPQELIDLDDEDVPLADVDLGDKSDEGTAIRNNRNPMPLYIGIGAAALIGIAIVVVLLLKKRKQ